ncbi:helix-turn-helix transcriptional regulator [Mameliella alba]|uniref:helix-turn-helix transcriptional regulator n=1 Tax=Mameliella alba TaxID=561184 RepID=UPI000B538193|nr:AlpA family phage regulatory protein [Mameliella alba]OWV62177.1 transcriptional regulator [Mameliella alba]
MKYLTFKQLRKKLGDRSRSAIYEDVAAGRLPKPIKLGGRSLFIDEEVDQYLLGTREADSSQ